MRREPVARADRRPLPEGWEWISLGAYVENHDGRRIPVSRAERDSRRGAYPYYGASGVIDTIDGYTHDGEFVLIGEDGANLLSRSKPIAFLTRGKVWVNNHAHVLKCKPGYSNAFLAYYINSIDLTPYVTGTAQPKLSQSMMNKIPVPVAPPREQEEIVAELEKQFSRLDEAVANLQRVKGNLRRYKTSVLRAAVEGRLVETEASIARRHGRCYEAAPQLLQRLLDERRRKWKGKFRIPNAYDATGLMALPEGWAWASLDALSWHSSYGTSAKCSYDERGVPILRIPNVQNGTLDVGDLKCAPVDMIASSEEAVDRGDMLVIRSNGSKSLIGRAALAITSPPQHLGFASYLIRFRLVAPEELPSWLSVVWPESRLRTWIESRAATSAGQHNISQSVLATVAIPVPPLAEQARIVAEVDRRLSIVRELEGEVDANLKRAQSLRQAILAKAFSGAPA